MITINDIENFNLDDTVTCGQIFRYEKELDNSYTIILDDRIINIKKENNILYIESNNYVDLKEKVLKYFDLERNYDSINSLIMKNDKKMIEIINVCNGLKMINSYPFETVISYIISANNSVSSIKKSVDMISKKYGKEVVFKNKSYYLFPGPSKLKNVPIDEYRSCSVGFRDKYIKSFVDLVNNDEKYLKRLKTLESKEVYELLQREKGIGPKVASCILLFAYQRFDLFPIDTWVKKIMKEIYNIEGENQIRKFAKETYGNYSAIAIQYMFHYGRNKFTK